MSWKVDWNSIHHYQASKASWESKLKVYEKDYANLVNQEAVLAQMVAVCENSIYLVRVLDTSIENMEDISNKVTLTGYNDMFDFDDLKSSGSLTGNFKVANDEYIETIKTTGFKIDELKTELASKISEANEYIYNYDFRIEWLKNNPSIWVED